MLLRVICVFRCSTIGKIVDVFETKQVQQQNFELFLS